VTDPDARLEDGEAARRATFIVRLTRQSAGVAGWRGEVEYVQRGQRAAAAGVRQALAQVARWLDQES
jgi:hypothetical protein